MVEKITQKRKETLLADKYFIETVNELLAEIEGQDNCGAKLNFVINSQRADLFENWIKTEYELILVKNDTVLGTCPYKRTDELISYMFDTGALL